MCCLGLGRKCSSVGSNRVGCRLFSKKTSKSGLSSVGFIKKLEKGGLVPAHAPNAVLVSVLSGLDAPALEASSVSPLELKERSSPYPPVFSTSEILSSTTVIFVSKGLGVRSKAATLGDGSAAPALVRSALGGVPSLPPLSEVYFDLQDMGADQCLAGDGSLFGSNWVWSKSRRLLFRRGHSR
jgi:hypothetical protein